MVTKLQKKFEKKLLTFLYAYKTKTSKSSNTTHTPHTHTQNMFLPDQAIQ